MHPAWRGLRRVIRLAGRIGKKGCSMARDPALESLLVADLAALQRVEPRPMFGGLCFMWRGHLLCGADHSGILVRLGKGRDQGLLSEPGIAPMRMKDRPMQGWVRLAAPAARDTALRHRLLALAQEFVASLPAK